MTNSEYNVAATTIAVRGSLAIFAVVASICISDMSTRLLKLEGRTNRFSPVTKETVEIENEMAKGNRNEDNPRTGAGSREVN